METNEHFFKCSIAELVYSVFMSEVGPAMVHAVDGHCDDERSQDSPLYEFFQNGIDQLIKDACSWCKEAYAKEIDQHNLISSDIFSVGGDAT